MILHRLRLTNFRGVANREITLPDHGVVVVSGPNEIGKSSMLEALDLLLNFKDRSGHARVKQVRPLNADVGAEVEAEISTGPYRFVYRKRFHKKHQTHLEMMEPSRGNIVADEAHDQVRAMLDETVDLKLWEAQRVMQSAATAAVDLSGCDALSRALDVAAGEAAAAPGAEPLLIERIDTEYARYFTGTGRPAGAWKAAIARLAEAEGEVAARRDAVDAVDEQVRRHEELTATLRGLVDALGPANRRLAAVEAAHAAVDALTKQVEAATLRATTARATHSSSAAAHSQRQQLIADAERRAATVAELDSDLATAADRQARQRATADTAAAEAQRTDAAHDSALQRVDIAVAAVQACAARSEIGRLAARVHRVEEVRGELDRVVEELTAITLTDDVLADIEDGTALVERLEAQLRADAAVVAFTATADLALRVDGEGMSLAAGQTWTPPPSAPVTVELPGLLAVRIDPGATAAQLRDQLVVARAVRDEALVQGGVADIGTARELARLRRALSDSRTTLTATLDGLLSGEGAEQLATRLQDLREAHSGGLDAGVDAESAEAELDAARQAAEATGAHAAALQQTAASAGAAVAETGGRLTLLEAQRATAADELTAVGEQLCALRAATTDESVAARATADAVALRHADAALSEITAAYRAADPEAVAAELDGALAAARQLRCAHEETETALRDITIELGVIGGEGRRGLLDEAQTALDHARAEFDTIQQRANAVDLLRHTMLRHRDNTRRRYVQPYRTELERLGCMVFGADFEVEIDSALSIVKRTLHGCTVPYDSLSGGAREQLGILARLAGSALVAEEDTVPVVIDDALGFSDSDRLAKMSVVFDSVGHHGQVIVLTCQRDRYTGISGAKVIELTA